MLENDCLVAGTRFYQNGDYQQAGEVFDRGSLMLHKRAR